VAQERRKAAEEKRQQALRLLAEAFDEIFPVQTNAILKSESVAVSKS
jgi:hypothetical protein